MNRHYIVSFYYDNLESNVVRLQRKVFNTLKIPITQVLVPAKLYADSHFISRYLDLFTEWDYITLMDIDCVPTDYNLIKTIEKNIDEDTLYGNAQISNVFKGEIKSLPFVGPHFMSFSRKIWEHIKSENKTDILEPKAKVLNPNGEFTQADRGEFFTLEAKRLGYKIKLEYPTSVEIPLWEYDGSFGDTPFWIGKGTTYSSNTYHNYEIRYPASQTMFATKCHQILKEYENPGLF